MQKIFKGKIPAYQFHGLQKFSDAVDHAVFSRQGGVGKPPFDSLNVSYSVDDKESAVTKNRKLIAQACGLETGRIVSANQTHSANVRVMDSENLQFYQPPQEIDDTDAFLTNEPDIGLMIKVADCQAIFMFDPVQKVIAAVHAGWKGLVQDISGETLKIMKKMFGVKPENVIAAISPSLGPCCAFFSDPAKELPSDFKPYIKYNKCVDLWQYSLDQLQSHGVNGENIELARVCSFCGAGHKFYSFRRDRGVTGRFGAVIWLNESTSPA